MSYTLAPQGPQPTARSQCRAGWEIAGVNRTFVQDIMRGKSANPNLTKLDRVAQALKVERNWLIQGMGGVHGEEPIVEHPDEGFAAISSVATSRSQSSSSSSSISLLPHSTKIGLRLRRAGREIGKSSMPVSVERSLRN